MPLKPDDGRLLRREAPAEQCLLGSGPSVPPVGVPRAKGLVAHHPCAILPWSGWEVPHHLLSQWLGRGLKAKLSTTATFTGVMMAVPPSWGRRASVPYPGRHSPKRVIPNSPSRWFHTPTPLNGFCFVLLLSNNKKRRRKKKKPAAHLCFSLCGLWFQPNKTIGHSNVSKTAFASLTCPPCPSPLRWHCGTEGPQFPPITLGDGQAHPHRSPFRPIPTASSPALAQYWGRQLRHREGPAWHGWEGSGRARMEASPKSRCEESGERPKKHLPWGATCFWPCL